jgi:hypothetical protein
MRGIAVDVDESSAAVVHPMLTRLRATAHELGEPGYGPVAVPVLGYGVGMEERRQ